MTMHLMGHAYTTLNTKKRKVKITKAKMSKYEEDHRKHNKWLKSMRSPPITLQEYIDYCHGKVKKVERSFTPLKQPESFAARQSREHREKYPSVMDLKPDSGTCGRREPMKYTGTLIKGIAVMHKSNAVPIIDEQQAKDIARMRR